MAQAEGRTTNALISLFHDEILAHRGEVPNFASFLRVTCLRCLQRAAQVPGRRLELPAGQLAERADAASGQPDPPRLAMVAGGAARP